MFAFMYKGEVLKPLKVERLKTLINKAKKIILIIFLLNY